MNRSRAYMPPLAEHIGTMSNQELYLKWLLRLTAVMLLSAAPVVVMPHGWMGTIHAWLGLGALPVQPIVGYLTRSISALYVILGLICWFISCDVRRYLPLLRFSVPITLGFALTLGVIDVVVDLPVWWIVTEGIFSLGWPLMLWWLLRRLDIRDISYLP